MDLKVIKKICTCCVDAEVSEALSAIEDRFNNGYLSNDLFITTEVGKNWLFQPLYLAVIGCAGRASLLDLTKRVSDRGLHYSVFEPFPNSFVIITSHVGTFCGCCTFLKSLASYHYEQDHLGLIDYDNNRFMIKVSPEIDLLPHFTALEPILEKEKTKDVNLMREWVDLFHSYWLNNKMRNAVDYISHTRHSGYVSDKIVNLYRWNESLYVDTIHLGTQSGIFAPPKNIVKEETPAPVATEPEKKEPIKKKKLRRDKEVKIVVPGDRTKFIDLSTGDEEVYYEEDEEGEGVCG